MKNLAFAWIGAMCCTLMVHSAQAQRLRQPLLVQPIGFDYNNYQDDVAASPSDQRADAAADTIDPGDVSNALDAVTGPAYYTASLSTRCGCESAVSCGAGAACGGCNSGCGGGCNSGYGCLFSGLDFGKLNCGLHNCCLGEPKTLMGLLHGNCERAVNIGGWASFGYHSKSNDLFNDSPNRVNTHQAWVYAEKVADACNGPFGFRADFMYGIDAGDTQAFGNPPGTWDYLNGWDAGSPAFFGQGYGWALPQLYGELAVGDWRIKAGKFFTLVGYEVVPATGNFFYSHAMTMYNSEPFTHTGVLATKSVGCNLEVHVGYTLGWDTGFDQLNDGSSWLGGFSYTLGDYATLTYISTAGNFGWRGDDGYEHSVVLDTNLSDKLNYVFQTDYLRVDSTGEDNFGINQYLLYTLNDCVGLGARMEWWKGDVLTGYAPHGGVLPAAGSLSYYAATFGANIRPHANVVIRPEVRVDWSPAANYDETYFGVDSVITF